MLSQIETRITDLGLNGKIFKLGLMRMLDDTIKNELKRGAKTIIVLGNNKIINQAVNALSGNAAPLGIIPIGEANNSIAKGLGIESAESACDILSARLIAEFDLGQANNTYFLEGAIIKNQGTIIDMSGDFTVEPGGKGVIQILNLPNRGLKCPADKSASPSDGILEMIINSLSNKKIFPKQKDQSVFKIKKITIINRQAQLLLDGSVSLPAPAEITVAKTRINIIVGKNRNF